LETRKRKQIQINDTHFYVSVIQHSTSLSKYWLC